MVDTPEWIKEVFEKEKIQERAKELLEAEKKFQEKKEKWKVPQGKKIWEGLWENGHLRIYQKDDIATKFDVQFFFPLDDNGVEVSVDIEDGSLEELVEYLVKGRSRYVKELREE